MKALYLTLATLIAPPVMASQSLSDHLTKNFTCEVSSVNETEQKLYDDLFHITIVEGGPSQIHYQRRHSCNSNGQYSESELIRGCLNAKSKKVVRRTGEEQLSVECARDGQEGIFDISPETGVGVLYFYYPKIGYPERSYIELSCFEN